MSTPETPAGPAETSPGDADVGHVMDEQSWFNVQTARNAWLLANPEQTEQTA